MADPLTIGDPNYTLGPNFVNPAYATPEQAARIKLLSEMLLKQGNEPAKHWTEALGNIAQTLVGTLQGNRYDALIRQGLASAVMNQANIERQRQGTIADQQRGGGAPLPWPQSSGPGGGATPYAAPATDAPSAIDNALAGKTSALSPQDRDILVRTVLGEAGTEPPEGKTAVANVIKNRMATGKWGPTARDVVLAKGQFEPWMRNDARNRMMAYNPNDPAYQKTAALVDAVFNGQSPDNTGGALNFYAPQLQAQLGRQQPRWASEMQRTAQIGSHDFFRPPGQALAFNGSPAGAAPVAPAATAAAPVAPPSPAGAAARGEFDPRSMAIFMNNPWISPEQKKFYMQQVSPGATKDVYGRPGAETTLGGVRGLPVGPGFQPGVMTPVTVGPEGAVSTQVPLMAPGPSGFLPSMRQQIEGVAQVGREQGQAAAANTATRKQIGTDVETAYQAVPIRQTLRAMKDDIISHGDKMIFGPTSDWINNLRKGLAQHAPGFLSETDIAGLAAADSFEKLSTQLQSIVGRQVGGTDASLLQGIKSVPGSHNSKEGALALIDMLDQAAGLNSQFIQENQFKIGQPGFNYLAEKNTFFDKNPIINPISKNPIRLDIQKGGGRQSPSETRVLNGKTYFKIDGTWHEGM